MGKAVSMLHTRYRGLYGSLKLECYLRMFHTGIVLCITNGTRSSIFLVNGL
jgi:hypothetical protein